MYNCDICGKCYIQKLSLKLHISKTHIEEGRHFECQVCNKKFFLEVEYFRHRRGVHEELKYYKCELCEKAFTHAGPLSNHIKVVHKKSKFFTCDFCGMISWTKQRLKDHIAKVHREKQNDEDLFSCKRCPKTFKTQESGFTSKTQWNSSECRQVHMWIM